ncbi:MAG: hypothetical protein EOP54_10225 [Sphingobacteriales bacterium]|nr:MAG: hypothetical protein EOP54_10225 [Sphingobacteriales bacterium]
MKYILLMSAGLMIFAACNKSGKITGGSACIKGKVTDFRSGTEICSSGATVKQYTFQSQNVYVFDQGTCGADFARPVLHENCDTLGFLGGIAGNGAINGQHFYDNATYVSTIWSN